MTNGLTTLADLEQQADPLLSTVMVTFRNQMGAWKAPARHVFDANATLSHMVAAFPELPPDFFQRGIVMIGGHSIDREYWRAVKPKPGQQISFYYGLGNGGGSGGNKAGKAILGLVLAVATVLTAGAAALYGIPALGIGPGSLAAKISGGISLLDRGKPA